MNRQLRQAVASRVHETLRAADADLVLKQVERWESEFNKSVDKILDGIDDYKSLMKKVAGLPNPDAQKIGKRGQQTSKDMYDRWIAIKDDLIVLKGKLRDQIDDEK
jgi:hypothetical protein